MAQLAIKGHATRGSEVIALLEMLGGKNDNYCIGNLDNYVYLINEYGYIEQLEDTLANPYTYHCFTLKEFKEKFLFKVGDKVKHNGWTCTVQGMGWRTIDNEVLYTVKGIDFCKCVNVEDLQPCKEDSPLVFSPEKMQEIVSSGTVAFTIPQKRAINFSEESPDETELVLGNDFEVVIREGETLVVRKNITYPKTYHECWKILDTGEEEVIYDGVTGEEEHLFDSLLKLKRCRDAYWKIAGDWEPDFNDSDQHKHTIEVVNDNIGFYDGHNCNRVLVFPTSEMRNAFYENFKALIEGCKELL